MITKEVVRLGVIGCHRMSCCFCSLRVFRTLATFKQLRFDNPLREQALSPLSQADRAGLDPGLLRQALSGRGSEYVVRQRSWCCARLGDAGFSSASAGETSDLARLERRAGLGRGSSRAQG